MADGLMTWKKEKSVCIFSQLSFVMLIITFPPGPNLKGVLLMYTYVQVYVGKRFILFLSRIKWNQVA